MIFFKNLFKKKQKRSYITRNVGLSKTILKKKNVDYLIDLLGMVEYARGVTRKAKIAQKGIKVLLTMNRLA